MDEKKFEFSGYSFNSEDELIAAKKEAAGVAHINAKINYNDKDSLYEVYLKLISKNLFKTVIGIAYLKGIRDILINEEGYPEDSVPCVNVELQSIEEDTKKTNEDVKRHIKKKGKKDKNSKEKNIKEKSNIYISFKRPFIYSIVIIVVLIIVIGLGFKILTNSENINIINYQDRLDREYESWEADLTERERILNEQNLDIKYDTDDTDTEE